MPILPTALLVLDLHHLDSILKVSVAKGKTKKTRHGVLVLYVLPSTGSWNPRYRSEPHTAIWTTNAKSLHEIFPHLSQSNVIHPLFKIP